jgi:hypothetical protein
MVRDVASLLAVLEDTPDLPIEFIRPAFDLFITGGEWIRQTGLPSSRLVSTPESWRWICPLSTIGPVTSVYMGRA